MMCDCMVCVCVSTDQDWPGWSTYLTNTQSDAAGEDLFTKVESKYTLLVYLCMNITQQHACLKQ